MTQTQQAANRVWARLRERIKRDKGIVTWLDAERARLGIARRVAAGLLEDATIANRSG